MGIKKTHNQFLEEISAKGIEVEVLEPYINAQTLISCKCKNCGLIWKIRPNNLLRGYGCPNCGLQKRVKSRTKDNETFLSEMRSINFNVIVKEPYKGARTPITCECKVCGNTWKASPTNLLKGKGCPSCGRFIASEKTKRTHSDFLKIIESFGHDIVPTEEYKGHNKPISMKCNKCGYRWTTSASVIAIGRGCPRCAGNGVYSPNEFVDKLKKVNPHIEVLSDYHRSAEPIKCKCLICGNVWETRPNNLLSGKGCPACYHSSTSFIEQVILKVFKIACGDENVISRDKKTIGQELDIFIPSMKLAIEPGSWRWHYDKIKRDRKKREKCNGAGIRLITVYSDYDAVSPPFEKDCICVKETLGFEKDLHAVKTLVSNLLSLVNIQLEISQSKWDSIIKEAYEDSRRITTSEFQEKIAMINNDIEVVGEYIGAWNKIECKCKRCGYKWNPAANSLLQGHGCPKCANKENGIRKRKTHEQFSLELMSINPQIKLLGLYTTSKDKIKCSCLICGYEWDSLPSNLLKGRGCPKCAIIKRNINRKRK